MYYNQRFINNYNDYYSNNYCCKDNYNDFDYNKNQYDKKSCCVRKVEETICCCPSYYNEDKKEENKDCKKDFNCWEGYFKIYGSYKDNQNNCNNDYNNQKEDCHRRHNCCGFCNLFRQW